MLERRAATTSTWRKRRAGAMLKMEREIWLVTDVEIGGGQRDCLVLDRSQVDRSSYRTP
jgi:hypothetical protein